MCKKPHIKLVFQEACYDGMYYIFCCLKHRKYYNHIANNCYSYIKGGEVGKRGRKRLISHAGIASMAEDLTKDSVKLVADSRPNFKRRCQLEIAKEKNWNSVVPADTIQIRQ